MRVSINEPNLLEHEECVSLEDGLRKVIVLNGFQINS